MAEPLKNHFGPHIPRTIAGAIKHAYPAFNSAAFLKQALHGYDELDLTPRAWQIAHAMREHLPQDYSKATEILLATLDEPLDHSRGAGMAPFIYLPHVFFVGEYGLDHFEQSMRAQYELTQRFTAEFSIRRYLERHQARTLAVLREWASDPSAHVRRLVSEGTRPRLPWAPRLREFQRDPTPVLELLELLKDDSELYVRRSVANNLNDIGKDHPKLLARTAKRWLKGASDERRWLVQHALRSAIKRGEPGALGALGFGSAAKATVLEVTITPKRVRIGAKVGIAFTLQSTASTRQRVVVDLKVHFVKSSGGTSAKVFKVRQVELGARSAQRLSASVSLRQMTTRKHYPGVHTVEAVLNGTPHPLGKFTVVA